MFAPTASRPVFPAANRIKGCENMMDKVYCRPSTSTKSQLKLSIGDPTFDGNLIVPEDVTAAVKEFTHIPQVHCYQRSWGSPAACAAVASYWGQHFAGSMAHTCQGDQVILTCGASEALLVAMTCLLNDGDNILIPAPGFPQYSFLCEVFGFEKRFYSLLSDHGWEADLAEARRLVDDRTRAILITNPSNPCGSNWSREHLEDIIAFANEMKIPIIADEIYAGMVYKGQSFVSVASFDTPVPRFVVAGLAKVFMVPGWRFGWVLLVDPEGYAKHVLKGMQNVSALALGPNALTQRALPKILANVSVKNVAENMKEIETNGRCFMEALSGCPGLSCPAPPQGALYIMVKIDLEAFDHFHSDVDFYMALEDEENVQVVPGTYMFMPGYFRVCITRPARIIHEVMERLPAFCERHRKKQSTA